MRPVRLTMSAFITYDQENVVIDFDRLGTSGLYLITGNTGSGKTTIFDAITFALFGKPGSKNRTTAMLRSKNADDHIPTKVELVFMFRGQQYTIERQPAYTISTRKTPVSAQAKLTMPDGSVISSPTKVEEEIDKLFGLNSEQFSQIAMIAQNDYLKVLDDDKSDENRKKLFRTVFKTERYEKLQQLLREKVTHKSKEYEAVKNSLKQYAAGIKCPSEHPLAEALKTAGEKGGEFKSAETVSMLKDLIKEDTDMEKKLNKEKEEVEAQITALTALLTQADSWEAARDKLQKAGEELEKENARKEVLHKETEESRQKLPKAQEWQQQIGAIEAKMSEYNELAEKEKMLETLVKELPTYVTKTEEATNERVTKTSELAKLEEERIGLENAGAGKVALEAKRDNLTRMQKKLSDLQIDLTDLEKKEEALAKKKECAERAIALHEEKQKAYGVKEKIHMAARAGVLAQSLKSGEACPVCGSKEHPAPAVMAESVPTEQELEEAKTEAENAREALAEAVKESEQAGAVIRENKKELCKKLADLGFQAPSDEDIRGFSAAKTEAAAKEKEQKKELEDLNSAIREVEEQVKRKAVIDQQIPVLQKERDALDAAITVLATEKTKKEGEQKACEERITELKQSMLFPGKKEAEAEMKRLQEMVDALNAEMKERENRERDCDTAITTLKETIRQAKESLQDAGEVDIPAEKEKQKAYTDQKKSLEEKSKLVHVRVQSNSDCLGNIEAGAAKMARVEEEYIMLQDLSATANGSISGSNKIDLEAFSQMFYMDNIIIYANQRLLKMTDGRFEFVRRTVESKKGKTGLDLDIIDHHESCAQASVATLSGGESFQAALSFQIGLADAIQSYAGGIQIDTLFVDEGFGSQSEEALDQVIRELYKLNKGEKLVGIISHVPELKKHIEKQIVITKDRGSHTIEVIA